MQNLIESINAFTNEWSMLISSGLILMLIIMIFMSRGRYKYRAKLAETKTSYDMLEKKSVIYERIVRSLLQAIKGGKRFGINPNYWLEKLNDVDPKFWSELFGVKALFNFNVPIADVSSMLNFIFRLKSAHLILVEATEAVQSGYQYYGGDNDETTFDISRLADDYIKSITDAANQLSILNMKQFKDQLIRSAEKRIKPLIIEGHQSQARHLIDRMHLGTHLFNLEVATKFAMHCEQSDSDPISFLDPDNEQHTIENLNTALEAVRLIKKQVEPEEKEKQSS